MSNISDGRVAHQRKYLSRQIPNNIFPFQSFVKCVKTRLASNSSVCRVQRTELFLEEEVPASAAGGRRCGQCETLDGLAAAAQMFTSILFEAEGPAGRSAARPDSSIICGAAPAAFRFLRGRSVVPGRAADCCSPYQTRLPNYISSYTYGGKPGRIPPASNCRPLLQFSLCARNDEECTLESSSIKT